MNLSLTNLDIGIFVFYMLVVLAVGVYASRRGKATKRDYFLSGDKLSWWMIGGSIVASNISSHHLIGVMGTAYDRGFVAVTIEWGAILLGFNALLWIFLPFYLRNGFYTMPEYLQKRFGVGPRVIYAILVLMTYIFVEISAVLYLGALALHSLMGIPVMASVIVLALATGAYTISGGLRAVVWTEMLQLIVLMLGGVALAIATINAAGGWSAVTETSDHWHLLLPASDPYFPWTKYLGGGLCVSVFYCATNQFIVQRALAAKNEWHARMGIVFADYLKFFMPLVIVAPGLIAPKLFPNLEKPDLIFPTLVENLLPAGLVGLVMAGLIAAVMSHISGAINSCTTILTVDFYLPFVRRDASESQAVRFGRISGAVIVVLGIVWVRLLLSYSDKPIFLYLLNAYGYFTPGIATMFLMGIFWKRTTNAAAVTASVLSIPMSVALQWAWPSIAFFNRTGIVFWLCMLICAGVSLFTTPKSNAELEGMIWNRQSLSLPPEQRNLYSGLRRPLIWWAIITVCVLFFFVRFP